MELFTFILLGCLCKANSSPLPGPTLLTPHFSTQPLPALMASHFRLWCPGLIPEEALKLVALRTLEPALARKPWPEGQASLLSGETLPVLTEARGQRMGKGVATCFVHHSVMATCFCLCPWFLQKTFWLWSTLLLSFRTTLHSQKLLPSWVLSLNPTL